MSSNNIPKASSSSTEPSFLLTCPENPVPLGMQESRHEQKFIDIHVKIGEKKHPAHRVVLANSCPVLKAMLSDNWDPEKKEVCELGEDVVDPSIADEMIDFLYTRTVRITMKNAGLLFKAAEYLDIPTLRIGVEQFLAEHLPLAPAYALDCFHLTIAFQFESIQKCCTEVIFKNYGIVFNHPTILEYPADSLLQLFNGFKEHPSIMTINEAMLELLIKWTKHDLTTRLDSLINLLKSIPLLEVSKNFLKKTIKEEIIVNSQTARNLVTDALNELSTGSQLSSPHNKELKKSSTYHLYCFGGYHLDDYYNEVPLNSVSHLNVSTGEWTELPLMIYPRSGNCATAIGDKIYIFGGELDDKYSNIAEVFDTKRNRWTQLRPMPVARNMAAVVAVEGYIYVSGGYNESDDDRIILSSFDRYCVATNEWTSLAPMLTPRYEHRLASSNGYIFSIPSNAIGTYTYDIEKYDPKTDKWEKVTQFYDCHITFHQGKFYAFNTYESDDNLIVYDPASNTSETLTCNMDEYDIDSYPSFVSIGDKIWAFDFEFDKCQEYDLIAHKWKKQGIDFPSMKFAIAVIEQ